MAETTDWSGNILIQVIAAAAHGVLMGLTCPDSAYEGDVVPIKVSFSNDGGSPGTFKVKYDSPQIGTGETPSIVCPVADLADRSFSFTMPSTDVSISLTLVRIT